MNLIYQDNKRRKIDKKETVSFVVEDSGFYLVSVSARSKDEKQMGGTDDEDLRIELDQTKFSQLKNPHRYLDSPASFSGGKLRNRKQRVFLLTHLQKGTHNLDLIPDGSSTLEEISVWRLPSQRTIELKTEITAEDGECRPWLVFVLLNSSLGGFSADLVLKRRFIDSDDVKIIVDGVIIRNNRSILHKFWYFIASLFSKEEQSGVFETNLTSGLHYIEFWADRMPILNTITFQSLVPAPVEENDPTEIIKDKIRAKAKEYGFDPEMMLRLAKKESEYDPNAISPVGAKGLFQLTTPAIDQIAMEGYKVIDPFDIDQNIEGAMIYLRWLYRLYEGEPDRLEKTLTAWNWGMSHVIKGKPIDIESIPGQTKSLINYVLNR